MFKRLVFVCISMLNVFFTFAQDDVFKSVQEVLGKQVHIIPGNLSSCTYVMVSGKLKPVAKDKKHRYTINGRSYRVENTLYSYKKANYLVFKGGQDIFFFKESDSPIFLSQMRNETVWIDFLNKLNSTYTYLDIEAGKQFHAKTISPVYDKLVRIKWLGIQYMGSSVRLLVKEVSDDGSMGNSWNVAPSTFHTFKNVVYIHKDSITPYVKRYEERIAKEKREQEIRDSIYNCKLRLAVVKNDLKFGDEYIVSEGDTVAVFLYQESPDVFIGCYHNDSLPFKENDIRFVDARYDRIMGTMVSEDAEYLKCKREEGAEGRYATASNYAERKVQVVLEQLERLEALEKQQEQRYAYLKSHQIFITQAGYNYDDEQFGMDYEIYNCFGKTIKYVVITLTCYNQVGDVQRDYFGNASRTVRGIGPIEPGARGSYSFEKVFWDEYGVIDRCKITAIKFIFRDGSSKSYNGYINVNKHIADDAWD